MYGMHPFRSGFHWHRGPSRLLWFIFGAGAASFWIKRKQAVEDQGFGPGCRRRHHQLPPPSPDVQQQQQQQQQYPGWPQNMTQIPQAINNIPPATASPPESYPLPPSPGAWTPPRDPYAWKWDHEREHLEKISKQASDAMADLTESTLESVLSTAESLKAKLAEHRAQRDKQQKILDQQLEAERKNPPRLV